MPTRLSNWPDKSLRLRSRHSRKGFAGASPTARHEHQSSPEAALRHSNQLPAYFQFLLAGVFHQARTGAIVPSTRFLVKKMITPVPTDYRGRIIELGSGTGALTLRLAARCPAARIVACEINPTLAQISRDTVAQAGLSGRVSVLTDPAERLLAELEPAGASKPDFIISGIPLAHLRREDTIGLIGAISRALTPKGLYIQFQYSLLDRRNILRFFPNLATRFVVLNFPPAVVYYARR
jgi:phospholipid N-methyltransferase